MRRGARPIAAQRMSDSRKIPGGRLIAAARRVPFSETDSSVEGARVATKLGITPDRLRRAAGAMGDLRDQVNGILATLETSLDTRGAAWGGDGYGTTFADGPEGYLAARKNLTEGISNTAKTLDSYSDGQYKAAALLARTDKRSGDGIR